MRLRESKNYAGQVRPGARPAKGAIWNPPMSSGDRTALPSQSAGSIANNLHSNRPRPDALESAERLVQTGSWEWDIETDVLLWSDNMFRLVGLEPGAITPTPDYVIGIAHPDDRERVAEKVAAARRHEGTYPDVTYRVVWPDDTVRVLHGALATIAEERGGQPSRLVGSVQDVTELTESQREMAESLTLMQTMQSTAPVGFGFVDREFRVVSINDRLLSMVGGQHFDDPVGRNVAEVAPAVWAQVDSVYRRVLENAEAVTNIEIELERSESQERRSLLASYYPVQIEKEVIGVGLVVIDITEREEAERLRAAVMDTMIEGLYVLDHEGRLTFMNAAASRMLGWSESELMGKPMHDAIHFQRADGSPHFERDCELLKVRTGGRPVRMAQEAFSRKDGSIFPVAYSAAPLMAGTNDGVVVVFRDTSLERAEEDKAKRELDSLAWVGRIRDALDEERLVLYSQPIVPLSGGQPSQELLLRMVGAGGKIILPQSFVPVAERYGLIGEIDHWVIGEAVRLAAQGQRVAANLSADSVGNVDLLPLIQRELRDAGADPANVVFEITETSLLENVNVGEALTRGLSEIGCHVALDDFGTGFGGFTYLKKLPINFLKIDIDFVRDLTTNHANQHLVRAIVGLTKDFGCQTIAEGVEDAETLALLREYGVDFAQGFHLGCPERLPRASKP